MAEKAQAPKGAKAKGYIKLIPNAFEIDGLLIKDEEFSIDNPNEKQLAIIKHAITSGTIKEA